MNLKIAAMAKRILLVGILMIISCAELWAQDNIHFTDFYISAGYRNQPYSQLNQNLSGSGYQTFNENTGILGAGISYVNQGPLGYFVESEFNLNRKQFSNDEVNYRYLPIHVTGGIQYYVGNCQNKDFRVYPKLGVFYGTTSLDLIAKNVNADFDQNLMGNMNTSFLYQRNYGINFSLNADKLLGAFLKPTTQIGVYSRMGIQVGYMWNIISSDTKLRRNFNSDLRKDFEISNAPEFDPSTFYVKLNFAIGKFEKMKER
ncbi:hypothetical protein QWY93_07140 [Echinicola jeungdonensis]|uniref:Outer membrane protein beta-barrel domain-containing protein n=1 Tax=Echinicola jeungdonensis TaxID=709343 RepID=A0ABV5J7E8_9BACT|nr:hypothetical protein [Echinicola jeungdonensis]MDN3669098.1 hypothetical protein [Echinicola jeungdonensis]